MKITETAVFENYILISASGNNSNENLDTMCIFIYKSEITIIAHDERYGQYTKRFPREPHVIFNENNIHGYYLDAISTGEKTWESEPRTQLV